MVEVSREINHQLEYFKNFNLIYFNQAVFMRVYSSNKLPLSLINMFAPIQESSDRSREDENYLFLP